METKPLNNVVIVGGGTAGWLTALYAKKAMPKSNIYLIESEDIGILGAGEGTVPAFIEFTDFLEIPVSVLVKEADATIKTGVKFTNWSEKPGYYYHNFDTNTELGVNGSSRLPHQIMETNSGFLLAYSREESSDFYDLHGVNNLSNKVPFIHNKTTEKMPDPILEFERLSGFSLHFNAVKMAKVLRKYAEKRGVIRIEGKVIDIKQSVNGDITSLLLENKKEIFTDFIFDCTGFARLFIGKTFKSNWISHKSKLTVNSAIPYFLPIDLNNVPAYTEAIAMKYGWMWTIPTTSRYGCGYVFNSDLITADEAKKEIDEYYGFEVESPRSFKFEAGYYETIWHNNCVALGLAGGFIEPLEATSIWLTISTLVSILSNPSNLLIRSEGSIDKINKQYVRRSSEILDFLYYHYMSGRKDTEFWEHYTLESAPETLQERIVSWDSRIPCFEDDYGRLFSLNSWLYIALGKRLFNKNLVDAVVKYKNLEKELGDIYDEIIEKRKFVSNLCVTHADFLKQLQN